MPDVLDTEVDNEISTHDSMQICSIEEMQEASIAAGWSCQYRQLQPGQLTTRITASEYACRGAYDYAGKGLHIADLVHAITAGKAYESFNRIDPVSIIDTQSPVQEEKK